MSEDKEFEKYKQNQKHNQQVYSKSAVGRSRKSMVVELSDKKKRLDPDCPIHEAVITIFKPQKSQSPDNQEDQYYQQEKALLQLIRKAEEQSKKQQQQIEQQKNQLIAVEVMLQNCHLITKQIRNKLQQKTKQKHQALHSMMKEVNQIRVEGDNCDYVVYDQQAIFLNLENTEEQIMKYKEELQRKDVVINSKFLTLKNIFQEKYQIFKIQNQQHKALMNHKKELDELNKKVTMQDEQVTFWMQILKLQSNPISLTGFTCSKQGLSFDNTILTNKNFWDVTKVRKITIQQIFYFVVIQLYKNWRKILLKYSFQSVQFRVLFGYNGGIKQNKIIQSLSKGEEKEAKSFFNKYRRLIAIGSPLYDLYSRIRDNLIKKLTNFENGLIKIDSVTVQQNFQQPNIQILKIQYHNLFNQYKTQYFQLHKIQQFTKKNIIKYASKSGKSAEQSNQIKTVSCIYVDIPIFHDISQAASYQQIYDYLNNQ